MKKFMGGLLKKMSWIIKIMNDETEPRYVEKLNGCFPPTITDSIKNAKLFPKQSDAEEHAAKIKKRAEKEGSDTTTIEVVEYYDEAGKPSGSLQALAETEEAEEVIVPAVNSPYMEQPKAPPKHSPQYIKEWGEPRGRFEFGKKAALYLYIRRNGMGELEYAYSDRSGRIKAPNTDGSDVIRAFGKEAITVGVALVEGRL